MNQLEECTREEFATYVNAHKELEAKPYESSKLASMMYINTDGVTMAQAIYGRGSIQYKIRKEIK